MSYIFFNVADHSRCQRHPQESVILQLHILTSVCSSVDFNDNIKPFITLTCSILESSVQKGS